MERAYMTLHCIEFALILAVGIMAAPEFRMPTSQYDSQKKTIKKIQIAEEIISLFGAIIDLTRIVMMASQKMMDWKAFAGFVIFLMYAFFTECRRITPNKPKF